MSSPTNTKTIIINLALSQIRQNTISSPDDVSEQARKANLFYDRSRRAVLRACDWNFATANSVLNLLGSVDDEDFDPTFAESQDVVPGYLYCYQQPAECLRVHKLYAPQTPETLPVPYIDRTIKDRVQDYMLNDIEFKLMRSPKTDTRCIVTNLEDAWVEYTKDISDEGEFDDMFVEAFALELAMNLCLPLSADSELFKMTKAMRDEFIGEAKRKNGGEGTERLPRRSNYEAARE